MMMCDQCNLISYGSKYFVTFYPIELYFIQNKNLPVIHDLYIWMQNIKLLWLYIKMKMIHWSNSC